MKYYYPDNLEAPAMLLLWTLQDIIIIVFSFVISLLLMIYLDFMLPMAATFVYALITLRFYDISIYDYLSKVGQHFLTGQQIFYWEKEANVKP